MMQPFKPTLLDRALASVAPALATRRLAARMAFGNLSRAYAGQSQSRLSGDWRAPSTAADAEVGAAGSVLRDRMRDLVRNNPMAAKSVQVLVSSAVGYGIRPRARSGNKTLNRKIDQLWERWARECDADGHTNWEGVLGLAVREMFEGGEVFAVRRWRRRSDGLSVPLQIQLMEADHLDSNRFTDDPRGRVSQGIQYDAIGRRVAYHLFPDHPGDRSRATWGRLEARKVKAEDVAHLFERQRTQSRGVPWGTPALRALRDFDDWHLSELTRKKTEACLVGVVVGAEDENPSVSEAGLKDANGNVIEQFEPGMFAYTYGAKDIKFNQPAASAGIYEWNSVQLHIIAAGFRVPYELMTGDLKQVNFSSSRVGLNEFRRMIESLQWQTIIPMFCDRIWRWFCEAAFLEGLIPREDIEVEWDPPRFESVNPMQDAQADLLEVRAGFMSPQQAISKRGYDPVRVVEEYAEHLKLLDQHGVVSDADPRKMSKAGQSQVDYNPDRDIDGDDADTSKGDDEDAQNA